MTATKRTLQTPASPQAVRNIKLLRGLCWIAVLLAVWQAGQPTALGGPKTGLILAATLVAALHLTDKNRKNRNRKR